MRLSRIPAIIKLAPLAIVAVVAAVLVLFNTGGGGTAEADEGHAGLNFSIGIDTGGTAADDCSTFSGTTSCAVPASGTFRVRTYLNALPSGVANYEGFDIQINHAGVTFVENSTSPDTGGSPTVGGNWPNCVFEAYGTQPGTVVAGCTIGISQPASTYTGRIATFDFQCPVSGFATITMVHGIGGSTNLAQNISTKHSEGASGTPAQPESLLVTCGNPPTATRTPTPTATATFTPTITNTPTNTSTPTITPTPSNTPTATPLPSDQADVVITKTDSPDPVAAGGIINYSLVVRNNGQQTAAGIIVSDFLPAQVAFISANSTDANCIHDGSPFGGTVNCTLTTDLIQNQQIKIVIQVTAHSPEEDEHVTNLVAVLASNEPLFNQGNNQDIEQTVVLAPRPDLTLTKTDAVDPIESGDPLVYNLDVQNTGPEAALDVEIRDNLPAGATYDDANSSPECDAGGGGPDPDVGTVDVVCTLGTVAGADSVQIAIIGPTVTTDAIMVNQAYVESSNELFSQTGNNFDAEFTVVLAPDPSLTITKTGPAEVRRAEYFAYTLTITNNGGGDAYNVQLSDTLPMHQIGGIDQQMMLQNVTGAATCGAQVGQVFTCNVPFVAANGGQVVLTVNVRAPTTLVDIVLQNMVSVSDPDEPGENPAGNSDTEDTAIDDCRDVTGDNLVRLNDILAIIQRYFAEPPNPQYDLLFDYDGSGIITLADILAAVDHYFVDCF